MSSRTEGIVSGEGIEAHGITGDTVACAELQVIEEALVLHESFFCEVPGNRYRWEGAPLVALAENGRTITTNGSLEHILAIERIAGTTIERNVADGLYIAAFEPVQAILHITCVGKVVPADNVIIEAVDTYAETVVGLVLLPGVTEHQANLMHAKGGIIVAIGFEGLALSEVCTAVGYTI